ncbi:LURP-one-related/scramblase family protein [Haloarchaeobius sp. TZWWS8]|uniref:LURP-one-related/scramblase family protein n=1 Tax=Haloarchaeobius sp. TZWWS8 TaxID=3446121 RepID=UPI003EBBDD42
MTNVSGLDLSGDRYTIKQKLIRNKYTVYDQTGTAILKAKQKMFKMKEEFPFTTPDGDPVFTIKAGGILDFSGDYTVTDAETGDVVAILDKNFTFFKHKWQVRDANGTELARIESGSTIVEVLRNFSEIFGLIPHKYTIESPDGRSMGSIKGKFSLHDTYEIEITDAGDAPKEALVIAAIAIDALEGN